MDFHELINYQLATITLQTGTSNVDNCGANGLPVTASSITIHGNYNSFVSNVHHHHLTQYLSVIRRKHGN